MSVLCELMVYIQKGLFAFWKEVCEMFLNVELFVVAHVLPLLFLFTNPTERHHFHSRSICLDEKNENQVVTTIQLSHILPFSKKLVSSATT